MRSGFEAFSPVRTIARRSVSPNQTQFAGGPNPPGRARYWFFIHYLTRRQGLSRERQPSAEPDSTGEKLRRLEAVLFLTRDGIKSRKLAKLAGLADATEARTLIRQLNAVLDQAGRSYRVEELAGGYALLTRAHFAPWLRRLAHIPGELRLSQTALETLAIVAYRQPVLRANIEAIRGVGCSEVLKQLMEMELVRISGRSEDLGRPYLYATTRRFLQIFGLRSADRLPRIDWVHEAQLSLSSPEFAERDSGTKESAVNMSFSTTAILDEAVPHAEDALIDASKLIPSAIDDDEDEFDDDEYDDDDDDDDEDEWDDEEDDDVEKVKDEEVDDEAEAEEEDEDDEDDDDDGGWEEVDDDDDWDDEDEDDDDDDWEEDEEDDDEEDWD